MTRVLHVVSAGDVGGAERMLVDLAARGDRTGTTHAVALFTPNPALRTFLQTSTLTMFDAGPAAEHPAAFLRRTLGRRAVRFVVDSARAFSADVVHVHTFASQVLGTRAAGQLGLPLVRTEHSTRVYEDPTCWPFARYSLGRAAAVVAISQHIAAVVRARAPFTSSQLTVVPCGVDETRFHVAAAAPVEPTSPLELVAVGRLEPRKGFDVALEAVADVRDVRLEIVGEGEERARLEKLVKSLRLEDRVKLPGWSADPRDAIARADAVLCSSRREGLGLAVLEAMALGRPAIAVPVGGVPEFVRDGDTGFLARGSTAHDLAAALRRAVAHASELPHLGANAAREVEARFTARAMADAYAGVYRAVTSHRP